MLVNCEAGLERRQGPSGSVAASPQCRGDYAASWGEKRSGGERRPSHLSPRSSPYSGPPSFLIIGGKDLMTSVSETEHIVSVLREKRVPVWYLLAKDQGHSLVDTLTYNYAFNAQVLFVKKYLISESGQ